MIKQEPNPQFFKEFGVSKPKQSKSQSLDIFQKMEKKDFQSNLFDFGLSDQDWGNSKTPKQKQPNFQFSINRGLGLSQKLNNFETFSAGSSNQKSVQQKKIKLQQAYLSSKKKTSQKQKQQTELEQIIKFNNQNQSASKIASTPSRGLEIQVQEDFFSLAEKKQDLENQFYVFDRPSFNSSQKKISKSVSGASFRQRYEIQPQKIQHFQTESLLENEQGTRQTVFSLKNLESSLCIVKFGIHLFSITMVCVIYGFMSSLVFLIIHDFSQFFFVILQFIFKIKSQRCFPSTKTKNDKVDLSMSDKISQTHDFPNNKRNNISYVKYEQNIKRLIKFHYFFKFSLYVSSISFLGFIIFHITQIDTFFSTNYFSMINWSSLIVLIVVLVLEGVWNMKMAKRIDEILFHQTSIFQDVRIMNEKGKSEHERGVDEENLWES